MKLLNKILDAIFPPRCAFCGEILTEKIPICNKCMDRIPFIDTKACDCCGRPVEEYSYRLCSQCNSEKRYFLHSYVPLIYDEDTKNAVVRLKHSYHPSYAKALAYLIADKILSSPHYRQFDFITCVPQNLQGLKERGYNHSELIARELSKLLKVPFTHTLHRNENGNRQATLTAAERKKNVRTSYEVGKRIFDGGTVLLVDDVYTTGETANYCAKLLHKIGFDEVYLGISMIRQ